MKKIIRSSTLLLGLCFMAGKISAQLASDAPASSKQQTPNATVKSTTPVQNNAKVDNNIAGKQTQVVDKHDPVAVMQNLASSPIPVISNQGGVTPVLTYTETKTAPLASQPLPTKAAKNEEVQKAPGAATQTIPVGSFKSSTPTQAPATTASAKSLDVNNSPGNGKLVAMPTLTLASGTDVAPVVTPAVTVQQTAGQPKAAEVIVTPPSVVTPNKAPIKQN